MTQLPDLNQLTACVIKVAREELLPRFAHVERRGKADGSILTEADLAMQQRLAAELEAAWPGFLFLGEEMTAEEQHRLLANAQAPLWCLDPLDGTRNFAGGIPYFTVSLALLVAGKTVLGVVYDPSRDECFSAIRDQGVWLNGEPLSAPQSRPDLAQATAIVDLKRLPKKFAKRLAAEPPYASQRSFGSVALEWCWLAAGRGDVYLHGRQHLWDYAAGHLIFEEAGGKAVTLEGKPLDTSTLQPHSAVAALTEPLFQQWLTWLDIRG